LFLPVPTALMASFVTATLGAPAAALGLIEGISDGLAGAGRFVGAPWLLTRSGGAQWRSGATQRHRDPVPADGATTSVAQAGVLRGAAWAARGLRARDPHRRCRPVPHEMRVPQHQRQGRRQPRPDVAG
jgi:hypothetical protein